VTHALTPDLCHAHDWSPIAAAASQSAIAAVLAGLVFSGVVVVLSVTTYTRESAQALKLPFTAFFGLAVTSYLFAEMAGEQTCRRADTTEALAGGALGAFAVIMITSLTWLVVAYERHDNHVLEFLHALVYVACIFVVLLLSTNSVNYLSIELPGPHLVVDTLLYVAGGLSVAGGAIWIWRRPRRRFDPKTKKANHVSTTTDNAVNWCAWAALAYLALTALATGVATGLHRQMWYPSPAPWAVYLAAASSLVLPLAVLALAIGGLARTETGPDHSPDHNAPLQPAP